MNDHNLDDLIIENIEPNKNKKTKSFLTIIALAIVILIVAIILTKIILKDPNEDQLGFEQQDTELVSPDLTLQSIDEPKEEIAKPIIKITDTPQESVVENISEPIKEEPKIEVSDPKPKVETVKAVEVKKVENTATTKELIQTLPEPIKEEPKAEVKEKTAKLAEQLLPQQSTSEESKRPANVITRPNTTATQTIQNDIYFIQVGSFASSPSQRFLDTIKKSGFEYKVIQEKDGTKKLLIGPYQDRASVDKALIAVRDRINKRAFVYKK